RHHAREPLFRGFARRMPAEVLAGVQASEGVRDDVQTRGIAPGDRLALGLYLTHVLLHAGRALADAVERLYLAGRYEGVTFLHQIGRDAVEPPGAGGLRRRAKADLKDDGEVGFLGTDLVREKRLGGREGLLVIRGLVAINVGRASCGSRHQEEN